MYFLFLLQVSLVTFFRKKNKDRFKNILQYLHHLFSAGLLFFVSLKKKEVCPKGCLVFPDDNEIGHGVSSQISLSVVPFNNLEEF